MMSKNSIAKPFNIFIMLLGLLLLGVVAYLDIQTGSELSLSIFYIAPVLIVTWYSGRFSGIIISLFAGVVTWLVADIETKTLYSSLFVPYWNAGVRLIFFLLISNILASLKNALEYEKSLARTDPLTGSENVRSFCSISEAELERARRSSKPLSVAYLDVDNFKSVNDTHGHSSGDDLLRATAETIRNNLRKIDILARLGGDEFAILLPETDAKGARASLERIRTKLLEATRQINIPVTYSIGIASFSNPPGSVDDMIGKADSVMYDVKNNGKNGILGKTY
jgi:diguanylate cyclase (GGDEF)-like protein